MDCSIPLDASLEGTAPFNTALQQISEQQHGAAQFNAADMSAHCSVNRCLNNCSQTISITTWPQSYIELVMYRIIISSNTNLLQGMTWFHVLPCFFYRYLLQIYISDLTSIVEREEVEYNRKFLSLSPSLSWHCTTWERTDWKSHMAGDKPRAGIVCTLCRGSGTLPPHLKGSSDLAEHFWGCTVCLPQLCLPTTGVTDPEAVCWCEQQFRAFSCVCHCHTSWDRLQPQARLKISALPYSDRWKCQPAVVSCSDAFSKAELASCSCSYITVSLIWL